MNIGSIPTVYIASSKDYYSIKGIILISPISKEMKIIKCKKEYENVYDLDILKNVIIPIFIIHGKSDSVINYKASQEFANMLNCASWFPEIGTHTKTLHFCRKKFFFKFFEFLENISYTSTRSNTESSKHNSIGSNCNNR